MANALTGDFEAVLQVSAATLDRLLAATAMLIHPHLLAEVRRTPVPRLSIWA